MIVNYKGTRLLSVPIPYKNKGGEIQFSKPVGMSKLVRILPGFNDILDSDWVEIFPFVEKFIRKGIIETFGKKEKIEVEVEIPEDERVEGGPTKRPVIEAVEMGVPLKKLLPKVARDAVLNCFNLETLNLWLDGNSNYESESRDEIRNQIKDQIERIRSGNKDIGSVRK